MRPTCVLGTGRLSFPYLIEPEIDPKKPDSKGVYNTQLLIAKDTVLHRPNHEPLPIDKMIESVRAMLMDAAKHKWHGKVPAAVRKSIEADDWLKDGDERYEEDPDKYWMYENCWVVRAKKWANKRDGSADFAIVGKNPRVPITDDSEVYAGRYANLQVSAWAYDKMKEYGSRGVSLILNAVQLVDIDGEKGDSFGGGEVASCESDFGCPDMDDPSAYENDGIFN